MSDRVLRDRVTGLDKDLEMVAAAAANAMDIRDLIYRNAGTLHDAIENLAWTGAARNAAYGRAEREYRQQRAIGDVFEDLHNTCAAVHDRMGPLIDALQAYRNNAADKPGVGIALDWTVTIDNDKAQAAADTRRLQSYADLLGTLDERFAAAMNAANAALEQLTPVADGLDATRADQDLADFESGRATPDEQARLRAATQLTPRQQADLAAGTPVAIGQGQFDYLAELMRQEDGASVSALANLGADLPPDRRARLRSAFTDVMQLVANPQVRAESTDASAAGGMSQLPSQLRGLLTENPIDAWARLEDWQALNTMLSRGDKNLAQGADLDRGVLKQTAEMSAVAAADKHRLLDGLLRGAGSDHQAAHDFATGHNMDITCDNGGHYNAAQHAVKLLHYRWATSDHGVTEMLGWIPGDIDSSNGEVSKRALETAAGVNAALSAAPAGEHLVIANTLLTHSSTTVLPRLMDAMPALEPPATTARVPDASMIEWRAPHGPVLDPTEPPSIEDVNQGWAGDCYALAALAGLAGKDPSYLQHHIHDNHNGTYTVDLFDGDGTPVPVTVTGEVPVDSRDGRVLYAHGRNTGLAQPGNTDGSNGSPQWAALYEKAVAEQRGGYRAIDQGGHSNTGIEELTGQQVGRPNPGGVLNALNMFLPGFDGPGGESLGDLKNRLDQGQVIVTGTGKWPDTPGVLDGHEYTVTAVDPERGIITVRNPWGAGDSRHPEYLDLTRDQWDNDFFEWSGAAPR